MRAASYKPKLFVKKEGWGGGRERRKPWLLSTLQKKITFIKPLGFTNRGRKEFLLLPFHIMHLDDSNTSRGGSLACSSLVSSGCYL